MRKQIRRVATTSTAALVLAGVLAWSSLAKGGAESAVARSAVTRPPAAEISRGGVARPPAPTAPAEAKPARVLAHYGLGENGAYRDSALVEFGSPAVGAALAGTVEAVDGGRVTVRCGGGLLLEYAGLAEVFVEPGDIVRPGDLLGAAGGPVVLRAERGGMTLDPVALLWPETSRFAAEAGTVEEERARLAEAIRLARLAEEEAAGREAGQEDGAPEAPGSGEAAPPPHLDPLFEEASRETGLDPRLLKAVAAAESGFDPRAVSPKGALGLMQLMPGTAREVGVSDPFDPAQSVRGGARYLRSLLDRFGGRLDLALAAYNAGPGVVERHGGVPPYRETREYVRRVIKIFGRLGGDSS
ncbi:transglycosylase SLT domain-containing protein [Desulfovirgula thermocuniculi]|uniref:lytic transglycosylase domain-containing protein n=1 Tax=Desulfovirgula thermocuniculi TaxID=348842 RepID=UPI0006867BF5|nr:transglycosylase SLT domain-containing protein [Desulfovirgula thermocuniculi]